MGYKVIRFLESQEYQRKEFLLDDGAIDLPSSDKETMSPGSEAVSARTGERWILNTKNQWVYCDPTKKSAQSKPDEVETVNISPSSFTIAPGSTIDFSASIAGSDMISDDVEWTVQGARSKDTYITPDGVLHIGENETGKMLTIVATSVADETKSKTATVVLKGDAIVSPKITTLSVYPKEVSTIRGMTSAFGATTSGIGEYNRTITWSLMGNHSAETSINDKGIVHIADDESAFTIIVKATSVENNALYDTGMIVVETAANVGAIPEITVMNILPASAIMYNGTSTQFSVDVLSNNNAPTSVIWSIEGAETPDTYITKNGTLYVGEDETAAKFNVIATSTFDATKTAQAEIKVAVIYKPEIDPISGQPKTNEDGDYIVSSTRAARGERGIAVIGYGTPDAIRIGIVERPEKNVPIIESVVINPSMATVTEGTSQVFVAKVLGTNNPSQKVIWKLDGQKVMTTSLSTAGVLVVGRGETAKVLRITATSVVDTSKSAQVFVYIVKAEDADRTVTDVPTLPVGSEYVRKMESNGRGGWVPVHFAEQEDFNALKDTVGEPQNYGHSNLTEWVKSVDDYAHELDFPKPDTVVASPDAPVNISFDANKRQFTITCRSLTDNDLQSMQNDIERIKGACATFFGYALQSSLAEFFANP